MIDPTPTEQAIQSAVNEAFADPYKFVPVVLPDQSRPPAEVLEEQVDRLGNYIIRNVPGEPSRSEGAIDTAIRLLARHYGPERGAA